MLPIDLLKKFIFSRISIVSSVGKSFIWCLKVCRTKKVSPGLVLGVKSSLFRLNFLNAHRTSSSEREKVNKEINNDFCELFGPRGEPYVSFSNLNESLSLSRKLTCDNAVVNYYKRSLVQVSKQGLLPPKEGDRRESPRLSKTVAKKYLFIKPFEIFSQSQSRSFKVRIEPTVECECKRQVHLNLLQTKAGVALGSAILETHFLNPSESMRQFLMQKEASIYRKVDTKPKHLNTPRHTFNPLKILILYSCFSQRCLILSGDVEVNPGPDAARAMRQGTPNPRKDANVMVTSYNVRGLSDEMKLRHLVNMCYKDMNVGRDNIFCFKAIRKITYALERKPFLNQWQWSQLWVSNAS